MIEDSFHDVGLGPISTGLPDKTAPYAVHIIHIMNVYECNGANMFMS